MELAGSCRGTLVLRESGESPGASARLSFRKTDDVDPGFIRDRSGRERRRPVLPTGPVHSGPASPVTATCPPSASRQSRPRRLPGCERRDWPHTAHRRPLSAVPPSTLQDPAPGRERQRDDAAGRPGVGAVPHAGAVRGAVGQRPCRPATLTRCGATWPGVGAGRRRSPCRIVCTGCRCRLPGSRPGACLPARPAPWCSASTLTPDAGRRLPRR